MENENLIAETVKVEIPVYTFWQNICRMVQFWLETARHPKTLILTQTQAEYVQGQFMSGCSPESIARAFSSLWSRSGFKYFQTFDAEQNKFVFKPADLEIEGLELIWATLQTIGALVKKRDGLYYQTKHPMVQKLAGHAVTAQVPTKKE